MNMTVPDTIRMRCLKNETTFENRLTTRSGVVSFSKKGSIREMDKEVPGKKAEGKTMESLCIAVVALLQRLVPFFSRCKCLSVFSRRNS